MQPKSSKRFAVVMEMANEIAREYDQEYVGTEHVLLAIAREGEGLGARVLLKHSIREGRLKAEVDKLIQKSMEETWVFGRLPGTPHFRNVAATAIEECKARGDDEVCTEHLLLALFKEKGCVAHKALAAVGLTYDQVGEDVADLRAADANGG